RELVPRAGTDIARRGADHSGGGSMRWEPVVITMVVVAGASAWAQDEEVDAHRTAVSAVGGVSVGSSHRFGPGGLVGFYDSGSGFAAGGGVAHDLSSRLTVEANGLYVDRGLNAWSADAGVRLNLRPSGESLVPYFGVSGGAYGEKTRVVEGIPIRNL